MSTPLNTRLFHRVRYQSWVRVIPPSGPGLMSNIEDISVAGLGLLQDKPVVTGGLCNVYFMLPFEDGEQIVQARCRIASCRPTEDVGKFLVGLAFVDFVSNPSQSQALVEQFVTYLKQHAEPGPTPPQG